MTESYIPDDDNDRYRVVKHGSQWAIEDVLEPNAKNSIIYPAQQDAQKWATRANERRNKASGGKTVTGSTEETA